jgi:thiol peroxidase
MKYGFAIKELRLLGRGIVVVDKDNVVRYVEYVKEVGSHPDYDKVLKFIETL